MYTNVTHQIFEELVPLVLLPLLKKTLKARTHWYRGPFRRFINTRFLKKYQKGMDRSNFFFKNSYKCITANPSAIWQHAAHTTDQLTSPSCRTGVIKKKPVS